MNYVFAIRSIVLAFSNLPVVVRTCKIATLQFQVSIKQKLKEIQNILTKWYIA